MVDRDRAVDEIVERRLAWRHADADGARLVRRLELRHLPGRERQAPAVVDPAFALRFRLGARGLQPLLRAVAVVRVAVSHQAVGRGLVAVEPLGLEIRPVRSADIRALVPLEPQPAQALENSADHLRRRPLEVGVFDAQHERAAVPPGEEIVEKRGTRAADVQVAGRRRRESDARSHRC